MKNYDFSKIEPKWQKTWRKERTYEPDLAKATRPFYNLMMFPYPSAEGLHVGNMYAFTGSDIYGRMKRMQGCDVFEPIGLDGFGIHSENYALKIGAHPMEQAEVSKERFYKQLEAIGNGFAWDERLETYDPEYYKWTQWFFIHMWKNGLAYRKKQAVNWCPSCKTVLSDEQAEGGTCERCGTAVMKKDLEQWFFRITKYADRLLKNLDTLDWSDKVRIAQRNWIGESEGALITFPLAGIPEQKDGAHKVQVFTTRPDTLFGATFMVVSPESAQSWLDVGWQASDKVKKYIRTSLANRGRTEEEAEKEKTGVFSGIYAINPANQEKIPVWVADYVLAGYGTGAIMAVPAHDERDFEFAKKYGLPVRRVIEPKFVGTTGDGAVKPELDFVKRNAVCAVVRNPKDDTYLCISWKGVSMHGLVTGGIDDGEDIVQAAKREVLEETGYKNLKTISEPKHVINTFFYHRVKKENRWARFHYVFFELENEDRVAVSEKESELHEVLWKKKEELKDFFTVFEGDYILNLIGDPDYIYIGEGILGDSGEFDGMDSEKAKWEITNLVGGERKTQYRLRDWLISRQRYWGPPIPMIHCDSCAASGKGEQPEMPGWYAVPENALPVTLPFVKDFRPTGSDESPLASHKEFYETTCPGCGGAAKRETDVSDTFLDSAWYYLRYLNPRDKKAALDAGRVKTWLPVHMYIGGSEHAVLHLLYVRFVAMVLHDLGLTHFEEPMIRFRAHGLLIKDGAKMSKSKGNVVNPDEYIKRFGADALRTYLMFLAPFEQGGDFRDTGILGVTRFLERVWKLAEKGSWKGEGETEDTDIERLLHQTIKKVTGDIETLHYNTAVSALMILLNAMEKHSPVSPHTYHLFLKLLAPFAAHLTEEIWREVLGNTASIHREPWPVADEKYLVSDTFTLVIQVNGKTRDTVEVPVDISETDAKTLALGREKVRQVVAGATPQKTIYVPGRLISFVV